MIRLRSWLPRSYPPHDFYYPRNEAIFTALSDAILKDEPTDAVTIASKIDHDRTGGAPYLFQLIEVACLPAHVEHHIQTLKTASARLSYPIPILRPHPALSHALNVHIRFTSEHAGC